jgi:hypothetical protein
LNPGKVETTKGTAAQARARRVIAEKYLEVAELVEVEDGAAINVCVGLAVLAGIAAGDAICIAAIGERYSGNDHAAAAELLTRVDARLGKRLRSLAGHKPASHYGEALLGNNDRKSALRAARLLVDEAATRAR